MNMGHVFLAVAIVALGVIALQARFDTMSERTRLQAEITTACLQAGHSTDACRELLWGGGHD